MKRSKIEIEEVKKNRMASKLVSILGNIDISDIETWWNDSLGIRDFNKKLIDIGCDINNENMKYILKDILNVSKKCKIRGKEIKFENNSIFCSNKCKKEDRLDICRTHLHNRRVKSGGKTTQSVSGFAKIKEANGICYLCGERFDTKIKDKYHPLYIVLDHVDALAHSNDSDKDNLKPVCRCCNTMKSDKPKNYYATQEYKDNKKIKLQQYVPKVGNYDLIDTKQFIIDCNSGITIEEVCKKYNRSNFIIWKMKQNLDIANKNNKLDKEYATKEVSRLTKEGKSISEIAEILKIGYSTVSTYRKIAVALVRR